MFCYNNLSKPGKKWRTNQNHISFPGEAQNKRINLTNPVLVSRWIAPNKVREEYQWRFKITKCLQNSILHHSKQEQRKYVSNWKVYNNWVATTSIFNVQAPFFGTRALYWTLNKLQWFIINHLNYKRHQKSLSYFSQTFSNPQF